MRAFLMSTEGDTTGFGERKLVPGSSTKVFAFSRVPHEEHQIAAVRRVRLYRYWRYRWTVSSKAAPAHSSGKANHANEDCLHGAKEEKGGRRNRN